MKIKIVGEFIKLGQLLKKLKYISSGGQAKNFLSTVKVKINDELAIGRGSKIHPGDTVWVGDDVYLIESQ